MTIERDDQIQFHPQGTLTAVTRWVSVHDEGIAEWLKNARRAYQPDRANVSDEDKVAVLLFRDASANEHARMGLLDVGGATLEDVVQWSTWQNPNASSRGSALVEEETQGNGGKAYMYKMFRGMARIVGVRDGKKNCKGFEGPVDTVERGTPGFMPDAASGREVAVASTKVELNRVLEPYGIELSDLPAAVQQAINRRGAFTLVEGADPVDLYRGQVPTDLLPRTLRHDQSTLAIQQFRLFAVHNRQVLNAGKPLELAPIEPFPGLEGPFVYEIPETLTAEEGGEISMTDGNTKPKGRLVLQTAKEHMQRARKNLLPRWKISYKASALDMIGAKPVSDFAPATPGASYIYGTVELLALAPGYVEHGRRRPKPGPLVEALDAFITEKIRELAKRINEQKRKSLDDRALDEVQRENEKLDEFKNKFLPNQDGAGGGGGGVGPGGRRQRTTRTNDWGTTPAQIELSEPPGGILRLACGVELHLKHLLDAMAVDGDGKPVKCALQWHSNDPTIVRIASGDLLAGRCKGATEVWATTSAGRTTLESPHVKVEVVLVDHVLLTPRKLAVMLGKRESIIAEVTDDDGNRSTDVLLNWRHEADDQLIVRLGNRGTVTGTRIGRTAVLAGGVGTGGVEVWSRIPVDVEVVMNPDLQKGGEGFPKLLVTGRDLDPDTGQVRQGDPDSPALWQEPSDFANNIWWLNLQSSEALFAFNQRETNPSLWRNFHAGIVMELVVHVHMQSQYTRQGEKEAPHLWAEHRNTMDVNRVTAVQQMWEQLEPYIREGAELE